MGESKSAGTFNDINAYSEFGGDFALSCINRLAGVSEWALYGVSGCSFENQSEAKTLNSALSPAYFASGREG
jgi:hypothetical protein